jgi:hypothetical protein
MAKFRDKTRSNLLAAATIPLTCKKRPYKGQNNDWLTYTGVLEDSGSSFVIQMTTPVGGYLHKQALLTPDDKTEHGVLFVRIAKFASNRINSNRY